MKKIFLLIALIAMFAQCDTGVPPIEAGPPAPLRPSLIYNSDSVRKSIVNSHQYDSLAVQQLKLAKELLADFPERALHHIKRSITYKPTREAYIQLGALLTKSEKFTEACQAYDVLTDVFPGLDKEIYFNMIYASLRTPGHSNIYAFVDCAQEDGVKNEEINSYIEQEPLLRSARERKETESFQNYLEGYGHLDDSVSFDVFIRLFDEKEKEGAHKSFPVTIDLARLSDISGYRTGDQWYGIQYYLEEMAAGWRTNFKEFKRLPDPGKDIVTVIYGIDSSALGARKEMRMIYYRLATYSSEGKRIDNMIIAKHLGDDVCTAEILSGTKLRLTYFTRSWKRPFDHRDMDNEVVATTPAGAITVNISETGQIIVTDGG